MNYLISTKELAMVTGIKESKLHLMVRNIQNRFTGHEIYIRFDYNKVCKKAQKRIFYVMEEPGLLLLAMNLPKPQRMKAIEFLNAAKQNNHEKIKELTNNY